MSKLGQTLLRKNKIMYFAEDFAVIVQRDIENLYSLITSLYFISIFWINR